MGQEILTLASALSGASEEDRPLLETLCAAAEQRWQLRLRGSVTVADCAAAFSSAVAFTAAADFTAGRGAGAAPAFTAGTVSIREQSAAERESAVKLLRQAAEELMAPYAKLREFSFKGVRG